MDRETLNSLYQYCFALTANESDAYDLMQSGIEKYLRSQPANIRNERAYIKRIVRNQYIDIYRKQNQIEIEQFEDGITYVDMDTQPLEKIVASQIEIESIWQRLTDVEREILYFWAVEGYSVNELVNVLDMPRGTLLSKIHRLRTRLEKQLHESSKEGAV